MKTWKPNGGLARADSFQLAVKSRDSVLDIFGYFCADRRDQIAAALRIDRDGQALPHFLHPYFFAWYFDVAKRVTRDDVGEHGGWPDQLLKVLRNVENSRQRATRCQSVIGAPLDVISSISECSDVIDRVVREVTEAYGFPTYVNLLTSITPEQQQELCTSLDLLREIWPEAFDEMQNLLSQVHVFRSDNVIGFTDFQTHGAVFLREDDFGEAVGLVQELLHESAHVRLNTVHAITPLFLNDYQARYPSPLRPDPRPMFGVFHQMFVLSRLIEWYARMATRKATYQNGLDKHRRQLRDALDTVCHYGKLTSEGSALVDSIRSSTV